MEKIEYTEKVNRIVKEEGFVLYDCKLISGKRSKRLCVGIDHLERKISLEDCARVSKAISDLSDREDWFTTSYFIEVSSPGVERELRTQEEFVRFTGETVKIILREALQKRTVLIGTLLSFSKENSVVRILERDSKQTFEIVWEQIKKANLYLEV